MKLLLLSTLAAAAVNAYAGISVNVAARNLAKRGDSDSNPGCPFTLSSSGSFDCPAGQLSDGQIRLNGSEETVSFYHQPGGGFIDQRL